MSDTATTEQTAAPSADTSGNGEGVTPLTAWGMADPYNKDAPAAEAATTSAEPAEPAKAPVATEPAKVDAAAPPADPLAGLSDDVKAKLAAYDKFAPTIKQLQDQGIDSADAVNDRLAAQQAAATQQAAVDQITASLRAEVEAGNMTPEQAGAEWNRQYQSLQENAARQRESSELQTLRQQLRDQQIDASLTPVYDANPIIRQVKAEPLVAALVKSSLQLPAEQAGQLVSQMLTQAGEQAVAAHVAKQASNAAAPPVAGNEGNTTSANAGKQDQRPGGFISLFPSLAKQYGHA